MFDFLIRSARRFGHKARGASGSGGASKLILTISAVLVGVLIVDPVAAAAPAKEIRRILVLNTLGYLSSPGVARIDNAIFTALEKVPFQIELYSEDMEGTLFPDEAVQQEFRNWYIHKYKDRKPDVIIAVGLKPLQFMVDAQEKYFPGVPVIFCGTTREMLGQMKLGSDFTGVWGVARPEKTLDAALALQPGTKQVVVVGGVGEYDRYLETTAKESFRNYESRLQFTYLTDLDMPTLVERLKHLPDHTIVYHTSIMQDASGTSFIDATQAVPMVASAANAPVFVVDDVDLGRGTVGGYLLSFDAVGRSVGEMAVRILNGERPQDIPIVASPNIYMFDWRALKRWGLKESDLPAGSIVLNRQPSVWEAYKWYILGGVCLLLGQTSLIVGLLWQRSTRRRAEAELALTFDRLRLAMETGKAVGWDWNVKTGEDRWFGDLQTVFGIPSDTYCGRIENFRRRVHPEDQDLVWKAVAESRERRKPYAAEFRVIRDDESVRWLTARGKFYYANNGDAERMVGMSLDITDRKLAEEVRFRHAAIVESSPDAIVSKSLDGIILSWNAGARRLFGYTAAEAIGQPIDILIPADRPDEENNILSRLRNGESIEQYETTRVTKGGNIIEVSLTISAIQDGTGKTVGYATIARDITERRRAEAAVRESEERFRRVANTAPVMIWMSGTDKLCNYFNKPWLDFTGRSLEQELGNGWAEGVNSEDLSSCLTTYTESFDTRQQFEMEYRLRRHDGEYRWIFDSGVPRFNTDGSFAGYIGSCLDVTERKRAEEALSTIGRRLIEAHEEERTRIGRELHDDINQRLALLAVELDQWSKEKSHANFSEHLSHTQSRIMEISKDVQALSHRLHSSKLDYLGLASAAKSFCKEFSAKAKVEVQFNQSAIPATIPKDVSLSLFRVLQESLQNAVKYSGVETFKVDLRGTSDGIELVVSDNGKGFEEEEAFSRHGLGLISMRERMQMVRGVFSVKTRPGIGTMISARVPLHKPDYRTMVG
ncbi:MAG TPA: ABC transporter substrate binding protein [Candidatus Sulfotelmatobacter sp.]|nr:ABC transporter substrate binding protein [Candidatus Sulfotelmatobacter sp.]